MTSVSVVLVTYDRPQVTNTLDALSEQTYDDYEVIVVNQGSLNLSEEEIDILIDGDDVGPAVGRNRGMKEANGDIIAFTDDDCGPREDWLENAVSYFEQKDVIGVEGRITSDAGAPANNPDGLHGYATANMLYRRDVLQKVDGFDERFGLPIYREDTDLAWRALDHGEIIYGEDVVVHHPESDNAKGWRCHQYDILLWKKHPENFLKFNRNLPIKEIIKALPGWFMGMKTFKTIAPIHKFILGRINRKISER